MIFSSRGSFYNPWVCHSGRLLATARSAKRTTSTSKLPKRPARTRFAPSPTGHLHLGSIRTALYNYLLAKATGGQFVLRIEDTDKKRTVDGAETRLLQDLKWAGLQWDEGPDIGGPNGPYRQSERTVFYQEHAQKLIESGDAYRCFCSAKRLKEMAKERNQIGLSALYDRTCLEISEATSQSRALRGKKHVVRLKIPDLVPTFKDLVYGKVGQVEQGQKLYESREYRYEDPILIKSDGSPTYHLANVVDDHYMGITHVIRATEWMPSTPKHLIMYKAFGWRPPHYAHVGLLQNSKREKFSKRNKDLDLESFRADGIFPEALLNFVALFGWSHGLGSDFISLQEMVKRFKMKFTKGETIVEPGKLYYLQKKYARKYCEENGNQFESMVDRVMTIVKDSIKLHQGIVNLEGQALTDLTKNLLRLDAQTYTTPQDFFDRHVYAFQPVSRRPYVPGSADKERTLTVKDVEIISYHFNQISSEKWTASGLNWALSGIVSDILGSKALNLQSETEKTAIKKANIAVSRYLRWAITGGEPGPGIPAIAEIMGRDLILSRLREAEGEFRAFYGPRIHSDKVPEAVSGVFK